MTIKSNEPLILDGDLVSDVLTQIHILLSGIRDISSTMTKEQSSDSQRINTERISAFAQEAYWKFQDLTLLKPTLGEFSPSPPDQTTTVLNETLDDDEHRGLQNTEIGKQLLQDYPDLLQLTLCYRELCDVMRVISRLLTLLSLLQEHGTEITGTSSTEVGEEYNSIRLKIDCRNEDLLNIQDNLLFTKPLSFQERGKWHDHYISGLEFAIIRTILKRIGGDFMLEKEDGHLMLTLEIPSLKEGKPDLLSSIFPKDFPPDTETND